MTTPLNPLIVERIRIFWKVGNKASIKDLLYELEGWQYLLGPGPKVPKCDCCYKNLNINWRSCVGGCSPCSIICPKCYQCRWCEDAYRSDGCAECGISCGAGRCSDCKNE